VIDPATIAGFAFAALAIELTPGPNMVWLAIVATAEGRRPGFAAVAGVALGLAVVGLAAALGLAALIAGSPLAYQALRWAGVAYLLWLAWDGWQAADDAPEDVQAGASLFRYLQRGFFTNLLNPKAFVFYITVLPGFLSAAPALTDVLFLTAVYVAVATVVHAIIVLAAGTARAWLMTPSRAVPLRRGLSLSLVAVAAWVLLKG
jgi:threonine/homoserine/homoserine lactone efflux protein